MNPWAIVIAMLLWVGSLVAVGSWQNDAGHVAERSVWQGKESIELRTANDKIKQMEEDARLTEHRWAQNQADIAVLLQKERDNAKRKTDKLIAYYRAGTYSLRDPGARSQGSCIGSVGTVAASPSGSNGEAGAELSREAAEFLISITGEADQVALQLGACQAVVISDRSVGHE